MKKIKFEIKKMHCNSCSSIIEDKLKEQDGIVNAKVSYESGKAVVVYDENKISENKIKQTIEITGDYGAEVINNEINNMSQNKNNLKESENSKSNFVSGIAVGAAIMAVLAFVVVPNLSSGKLGESKKIVAQVENNDNNNNDYVAVSPKDIEISSEDHSRGNVNADITIVEYSDFQCPFCARFHTTMEEVMENFGDKVRWVYKHFPLDSIHPYARKAAEASECAADQNKFWEYNDELFANQSKIKTSFLSEAAQNIGLNISQFEECLDSGKYEDKVENDYQEGISLGVRGTPGGFINGEELGGAVPYSTLEAKINNLL